MSCSFISLAAQYDSCVREEGGESSSVYLAMTPNGPAFVTGEKKITRIFDSIFHRYSFDIIDVTQTLIKNIAFELPSEGEIPSLFKVMKIAKNMLKSSHRNEEITFKSLQRKFTYHAFVEAFDCVVERIARERGSTKAHVYLEYGYKKSVYTLIRKEMSIFGEDPNSLRDILQMACERRDDTIIFFLVQSGVSIGYVRDISPDYLRDLAKIAYTRLLDDVLAHFVREVDVIGKDKELYFKVIKSGLTASFQAFLQKEASLIKACDVEGNSPLHLAFLSKNASFVKSLFERYDPTVLNNAEETPLRYFLNKASPGPETEIFLQNILTRSSGEFQKSLPNISEVVGNPLLNGITCDCIELFYLLQKPLSDLSLFIKREDVEASLPSILKRFPQCSTDSFYLTAFFINKDHLKTGCERRSLSLEAKATAQLSDLESLFLNLNWKSIHIKKFYEEVFEVEADQNDDLLEKLKEQLKEFLQKIHNRTVFIGTPHKNPALEEFYFKIELALKCCCTQLQSINKPEITLSFFKEILTSSRYCGSRYFQTAINLYLLICKEVEETNIGFFERLLADYRRICFEGVVGELNNGIVHAITNATKDLGEELGIPGSSNTFDDTYFSEQYNKNETRKVFFEKAYTPYAIVFHCIFQTCVNDSIAAEKYVDIQKELMPIHWNEENYNKTHEAIKKLPPIKDFKEQIKQENILLKEYSIPRHEQANAHEAIENARKVDYLGAFVYTDSGKRSIPAVLYLLERLGVLSCTLQWGDQSKKVIPLVRQEPYKKVSWSTLFNRLSGFFKNIFS